MTMILLDTNVISEPTHAQPDAAVVAWLNGQRLSTLYLSTITLAEMRFGIAQLPEGRKKNGFLYDLETQILPLFSGRVLNFDQAASESYGVLRAQARTRGRAVAPADGYIAAIAHAHNMTVATRDIAPFLAMGVPVINPWNSQDPC